jgi:hypothetical protein
MHERLHVNAVSIPRMIFGEQNPLSEAEQNTGSYFAVPVPFCVLGPGLEATKLLCDSMLIRGHN